MRDAESDLQMCDAATPGPWRAATNRHPETTGEAWGWIEGPREHYCWTDKKAKSRADARFIAMARTALPFWIHRAIKLDMALGEIEATLDHRLGPNATLDDLIKYIKELKKRESE